MIIEAKCKLEIGYDDCGLKYRKLVVLPPDDNVFPSTLGMWLEERGGKDGMVFDVTLYPVKEAE